ncbi:DUF4406 domain-containing protein [Brachybacterium sp. GPGPB12]|uniref:DUF4406 domain-containing protein n=1 Tax=Brachybacterium sp. GPGPB12 TaxID=3023517 RepID=UPI003134307E
MSALRIYIAGPMSGLPDFNYPSFDRAEQDLAAAGYEPLSPAVLAHLSPTDSGVLADGLSYEDVLAAGLQILLNADAVALLGGWESSHGARLEVALARRRDLLTAPVAHWLSLEPVSPAPEADRAGAPLDSSRVAEIERNAPTVMVDPLGTPADLRASLMRLGDKVRADARRGGKNR